MQRRDLLRAGVATVVGSAVAGRTSAHPEPFEPLGSLEISGTKEAVVGDDGTTVYLATTSGFAVLDVSLPSDPVLLAEERRLLEERANGPLGGIYDVAVDGDRLLVVGRAHPDENAIHAAVLYDVSDPESPVQMAVHETEYPIHNADLVDGFAYLTATDGSRNPLVILDIQEELGESARYSILEQDKRWADVKPILWTIHDVTVHDGVAYLAHWEAGTWMLDVSDPTEPTYRSHVATQSPEMLASHDSERAQRAYSSLPGNAHYATVGDAGDVLGVGREAWAQSPGGDGGPGTIELYDVADSQSPTKLATIQAPETPDATRDGTWTTAHNFELTGGTLYSSWYQGGVKIHDIQTPSSPTELAWWHESSEASFWTLRQARGCLVASSFRPTEGLYTFPDHAGAQPGTAALSPRSDSTGSRGRGLDIESGLIGAAAGVGTLGLGALAWRYRQR